MDKIEEEKAKQHDSAWIEASYETMGWEKKIEDILNSEPVLVYPSVEAAKEVIGKRNKRFAHQICRLLEPKHLGKAELETAFELGEPKPDGSRLLTDEELDEIMRHQHRSRDTVDKVVAKAQLAKDMKWEAKQCANCDTPLLVEGRIQEAVDKVVESAFKAGKQEGIKEVVEWIKGEGVMGMGDNGLYFQCYIAEEKWQAKLKEWGTE